MKLKLKRLLEFVLPESWRGRAAPSAEANDWVLRRLQESDGVYRALMDHAYVQFEGAVESALQEGVTAEVRAYRCGQARALAGYVGSIEGYARAARRVLVEKGQKTEGKRQEN
jgi:hypothetical protein